MESESEVSERFHFFAIPFTTPSHDPLETTLLESETEAKEPTSIVIGLYFRFHFRRQ